MAFQYSITSYNIFVRNVCMLSLCFTIVFACKNSAKTLPIEHRKEQETVDTISAFPEAKHKYSDKKVTTQDNWYLMDTMKNFYTEIRYASSNNFTKKIIYNCPACYVRKEVASSLMAVSHELISKGYKLKLFDCYRPKPAQQKLWDIVPDARYVTPPHKGSMHSRGLAVDITLTDVKGTELDMGTPYDYFGVQAHIDYTKLSKEVLERRILLKESMEKAGFKAIRTEWWHYSKEMPQYTFSSWQWPCN